MNILRIFLLLAIALYSINGLARVDAYPFDDPAKETVYKKMIQELRCLVCQNQNLADSNAELAMDLRRKTYEMAAAGKSEDEIVDYMTQRYGDFVLYRPPLTSYTFFLWLGPFVLLFLGLYFLIKVISGRRQNQQAPMTEEEKAKAADLLKSE
jgi:cytochrome c-type biogenesis protein CcmH